MIFDGYTKLKYIIKINFLSFSFFNIVARIFKITNVAYVIFVLDSGYLEDIF